VKRLSIRIKKFHLLFTIPGGDKGGSLSQKVLATPIIDIIQKRLKIIPVKWMANPVKI
jgi:hypothetical protein